jgi:hypothetical protein
LVICLLAGLFSVSLSAQSLEDVFDDGVRSSARNVIRTDLFSLYRKQATLSYERLFGSEQRFGVEVGGGYGKYRRGIITELIGEREYDLSDASRTNSVFLNGRIYTQGIHETGYLFVFGVRSYGFDFDSPDYNAFRVTDVTLSWGLHFLALERFVIEPQFDIIYRSFGDEALAELQKRDPSLDLEFGIEFQLGFEVGYLF